MDEEKDIYDHNGRCEDSHPSGTHIAGIMGAKNNDIGVVGIVFGIPIIAIKVFGSSGVGSTKETETSTVLKWLHHVLKYGKKGDVVNLSFGGELDENEKKVLDRAVLGCQKIT